MDIEITYHLNRKFLGKDFHAIVDSALFQNSYSKNRFKRIGFNENAIESSKVHHLLLRLMQEESPIISIFLQDTNSLSDSVRYQLDEKLVEVVRSSIVLNFDICFFVSITKVKNYGKRELHLFTKDVMNCNNEIELEDKYNEFISECIEKGGFFA